MAGKLLASALLVLALQAALLPAPGVCAPGAPKLPQLTESVSHVIPQPLTAQMVWLVARAEAWLTALDRLLPSCPVSGSAGLALPASQRRAMLVQIYDASAQPLSDADKTMSHGRVTVQLTMQTRDNVVARVQMALQNPGLLQLRQRLLDETAEAVDKIKRNWITAESLDSVWGSEDWKKRTDHLQGLWLAQRALDLADEGWLARPSSLAALDLACRLAPDSAVAHLLLAEARVQRNLPQQAIVAASEALRLWPDLGRARHVRALAHWRLQQLALAEHDLNAAISPHQPMPPQGPELARCLRARGAIRLLQGNEAGLCEDFANACALGDCDGLVHAREQGFCQGGK